MDINVLEKTIQAIAIPGRGILAADESTKTIAKRFEAIKLDPTEENRRAYRELLFTTPKIARYISGVILFEETLNQRASDNMPFPQLLAQQGIVPGIKVDKGLIQNESAPNEQTTQGLDGLPDRLVGFKEKGARFAKWRVVYKVTDTYPSKTAIKMNATLLARYARICQNLDIIPIVEPEVLMDGKHSIERCAIVTEAVQHTVFKALIKHKVILELMILKPNMVIAGLDASHQPTVKETAAWTVKILRRTTPAAVPTINFLSGGQSDELATQHLKAINQIGALPWNVSFSYGRALQAPCLSAWEGKEKNVKAAQNALFKRAKLNGATNK